MTARGPRTGAGALLLLLLAGAAFQRPALGQEGPPPDVALVPEISLTPAPAGEVQATPDELLRARLRDLLNWKRAAQGLAPVDLDPALDRAAQRHVDDMMSQGYVAFTSPSGETIDVWVEAEGYAAALVAEKLVQAPAERRPEELVEGWAQTWDRNEQSLFHPEVRQLGVGLAAREGVVTYALVLARPTARAAAPAAAPALATLPGDLTQTRAEYLVRVNAMRREAGLSPLQHDPALDRPAQDHAEAVLVAIRRGVDPDGVEALADRVQAALGGLGTYRGVDRDMYWSVGKGRIEPRLASLGHSIVTDAASPAAAVATALALQQASDLREPGFRRLGLGFVQSEAAGVPRTVWVAVLLPPQ